MFIKFFVNYGILLSFIGSLMILTLNVVNHFTGPVWPQLVRLWCYCYARYRVRSRIVALLKRCELQNWQRYMEESEDFWLTLPSFLLDLCHPKRDEYHKGYLLAVHAMDQEFDTQFAKEIQEEYRHLYK